MRTESPPDHPVLVLGAGWVGLRAARELASTGHPVLATNRSGAPPDGPNPSGLSFAALDLAEDDETRIAELVAGHRTVIACWAPGRSGMDRRDLYVGGARKLAAACRRSGPERLIYTSSTSALPDVDGVVNDDCDLRPTGERGLVQREAEDVLAESCAASGTAWIILRLAGLYGPGRELGRIYRSDPDRVLAGSGCAPTNLVHQDDVQQAIAAAIRLDTNWSGVVNVCAPDHRSRRELFAEIATRKGMPPPCWEKEAEEPRGKRVASDRLGEVLAVSLQHPVHQLG